MKRLAVAICLMMLTSCGDGRPSPITTPRIPAGMRGIAVQLSERTPVATGEHVDLFIIDKGQTVTLAQNLEIAAVDRDPSGKRPPIVHFIVAPDTAKQFEESVRVFDWYATFTVRVISSPGQPVADS